MATKSEQQIERDFYSFLKDSDLGKAIKGSIYRADMRPADAKTEDLVVKFLAGLDEQIQTGVVILNLYVPDIKNTDGRMVKNMSRIGVLEDLITSFVEENEEAEYWMEKDGTPTSMKNEDIEQTFIYARIKFSRLSND